jgi:hypothetical protein
MSAEGGVPSGVVKKRHVAIGVAWIGALGSVAGVGFSHAAPGSGPTTVAGLLGNRSAIYGAGIYHIPAAVPARALPAPEDIASAPAVEEHGIDERPDVDDLLAHIAAAKPEPTTAPSTGYRWEIELVGSSGDPARDLYLSDVAPVGMIGRGGYVRFADDSLVRYLVERFPRATAGASATPSPAPHAP